MATREELRTSIKFCYLKGDTVEQCHNQLVLAYKDHAYSLREVVRWYKRFDSGEFSIADEQRSGRPTINDKTVDISSRIGEHQSISQRSLARQCDIHRDVVCRIAGDDLGLVQRNVVTIPHNLNPIQKMDRIVKATIMAEVVSPKKPYDYRRVLTLDESWILFENIPNRVWAAEEDDRTEFVDTKVGAKKMMVTIVMSGCEFWLVDYLPEHETLNAHYFLNNILIPLQQKILSRNPAPSTNKWILHMDNSSTHTAKIITDWIQSSIFSKLDHPSFSPDISPCDFYLFGRLKGMLAGQTFTSRETLKLRIQEILTSIKRVELISVFDEWVERLNAVKGSDGGYIS